MDRGDDSRAGVRSLDEQHARKRGRGFSTCSRNAFDGARVADECGSRWRSRALLRRTCPPAPGVQSAFCRPRQVLADENRMRARPTPRHGFDSRAPDRPALPGEQHCASPSVREHRESFRCGAERTQVAGAGLLRYISLPAAPSRGDDRPKSCWRRNATSARIAASSPRRRRRTGVGHIRALCRVGQDLASIGESASSMLGTIPRSEPVFAFHPPRHAMRPVCPRGERPRPLQTGLRNEHAVRSARLRASSRDSSGNVTPRASARTAALA